VVAEQQIQKRRLVGHRLALPEHERVLVEPVDLQRRVLAADAGGSAMDPAGRQNAPHRPAPEVDIRRRPPRPPPPPRQHPPASPPPPRHHPRRGAGPPPPRAKPTPPAGPPPPPPPPPPRHPVENPPTGAPPPEPRQPAATHYAPF